MKTRTRVLAGSGVATAILAAAAAAGIGIAAADPPTPSSPSSSPSSACHNQHRQKRAHNLFQRTEHAQLNLAGKKHRVVDVQRGTVKSISSTEIRISSTDGFTASYSLTSKTLARHRTPGNKPTKSTVSAIKTGDRVRVIATQSGKTTTANRIVFTA